MLRGCRLVAVLERNCCLYPTVCVITTIIVIVFTEEMLMRAICMKVLLGTQCPEHPDHSQQGCENMLLSYQLADGCHTQFCLPLG